MIHQGKKLGSDSTHLDLHQKALFLKDYTEVLLADAYGGYNGVVAGNAITRAGCWSHARRKFGEVEKTAPEIAREAVDLIGRLFAVEKQAKDMSVAERLALRQTQSVRCWRNYDRSCWSGKNNCCQSIPWRKP